MVKGKKDSGVIMKEESTEIISPFGTCLGLKFLFMSMIIRVAICLLCLTEASMRQKLSLLPPYPLLYSGFPVGV